VGVVSSSALADPSLEECGFHHEAFFYDGEDEFLSGAAGFLSEAIAADEPALVVVSSRKIDLLRDRLGGDVGSVVFADMEDVGTNPARIIPAWTEFVQGYGERPLRGIGEPIWAQRSADELVECQQHESLLNVAFAGSSCFTLMCPYDTSTLDGEVIEEARRSHRFLRHDGAQRTSDDYLGTGGPGRPFSGPLPEPPTTSVDVVFRVGSLGGVRSLVVDEAMNAGLGEARASDMVVAVNEAASNSVRYGGGQGILRIWTTADSLICQVSDRGYIDDALVGRVRPTEEAPGGRGLWMVNQLCELVQVRSLPEGTTVRMHIRRPPC
jgi:anti-sigma regulatory factor (Ser/Thr protein kinase)